jgi:NADPH2:quinone reductase
MRAVVCSRLAPPEELTLEERPSPVCAPNQVRVHVAAAGLNYVDGLFVQGLYQIKPPLPFVPGSELSGTVVEVGSDVVGWSLADRVIASVGLGAFCDELVVDASQLVRVPDGVDLHTAAALGQSYCTAWFALQRRAAVQPDEWLLVLGGAGGVGLASIDVGRALGARVIAAASTPEKRALCEQRGAMATIDTTSESVKDRARSISGGGVDVAVDPVGGELTEQALRALGFDGRLLIIGFASGTIPALPANQILLRNRRVVGVDWGAWALGDPKANAMLLGEVLRKVADGTLSPVQPTEYPLAEAGRALRDLLDRRVIAKAVLLP